MSSRSRFLILSASDATAESVRDLLAGYRDAVIARTAAETLRAAGSTEEVSGLVVLEPLADAVAAEIAALVRELRPGLPILIATPPEHFTTTGWRAAHRLGALHAPLPLESQDLVPFVTRAIIGEAGAQRRLRVAIERAALRASLSPLEVELLALAVCGHDPTAIAARMRLSPGSYKRRVAALIMKLGVERLQDAVVDTLRMVSGLRPDSVPAVGIEATPT